MARKTLGDSFSSEMQRSAQEMTPQALDANAVPT
jgi:hypothetical protein